MGEWFAPEDHLTLLGGLRLSLGGTILPLGDLTPKPLYNTITQMTVHGKKLVNGTASHIVDPSRGGSALVYPHARVTGWLDI